MVLYVWHMCSNRIFINSISIGIVGLLVSNETHKVPSIPYSFRFLILFFIIRDKVESNSVDGKNNLNSLLIYTFYFMYVNK